METNELTTLAADLALNAGETILKMRSVGVSIENTKSSSTDIVTAADKAAEEYIVSKLRAARPNDSILGEEGAQTTGSTEITWIIDPIDGTVNYLYDLPAYCVSVAACVRDSQSFQSGYRAVAAAVYNPKTKELFTATEGSGAFLNGARIRVSNETRIEHSLVATGFGYSKQRRLEQHEILGRVIGEVRDIRRIGTAAYDLCLVAAGRLEGYFEKGIQPWDWAGGALIAQEAGASLLGADEQTPPGEEMFIAGPPVIASALSAIIQGS